MEVGIIIDLHRAVYQLKVRPGAADQEVPFVANGRSRLK
jgi:hypothetical protein